MLSSNLRTILVESEHRLGDWSQVDYKLGELKLRILVSKLSTV